jgi:hypothetical protein
MATEAALERKRRRQREFWAYQRLHKTDRYFDRLAYDRQRKADIARQRPSKFRPRSEEFRLISETAVRHGLASIDGKTPAHMRARCEAAYRLRTEFGYSYPMVATALNRIQRSGLPDHERAILWVGTHALRESGEYERLGVIRREDFVPRSKERIARARAAAKTVQKGVALDTHHQLS